MIWFQRLFPAFMVLFPLAFTLLAGRHPERAHDDVPQLMRRLWVATLIALALHIGMQSWIESDPTGLNLLRAAWPVGFGVGPFMVLWFGFAGRALQARQPGYRPMPNSRSREPVRSASLTRRDATSPLPRGAWVLGWTLFGLCVGAVGWSIAKGAPAMLMLGLFWWIGFSVFGSRASQVEAEPMDAPLEIEYHSLRPGRQRKSPALSAEGDGPSILFSFCWIARNLFLTIGRLV